ncbi:MAG TPA: hydrogenase maturation protease, partial [Candidatus Dormibacteraeota bacterium]|nr:hydrogenase maturation protease [Candidatus Dormibacteraeota bacterium]
LLEPQVPALEEMAPAQRRDFLADMHWADPTRALILAKALGVLPPRVLIVGCQPGETEQVSLALSPAVAGAVPRALHMIDQALERLR